MIAAMSLPYEVQLSTTAVWENGRAAAWSPFTTDEGGYYTWGTGARWRWTTTARRIEVDAYVDQLAGRQIAVRVADGSTVRDYYFGAPDIGGTSTTRGLLPIGLSGDPMTKTVELYVPGHHALGAGAAARGAYPIRVRFDAPATPIAPTSPTYRLFVLGDSIATGGSAIVEALQGWAGLAKRGLTCQIGTNPYKGVYSGATAYAIGDLVRSGKFVWRNKIGSTGVAPAVGATWEVYGFDGLVTLFRTWGYKRVTDDWSTGGDRTTNAALLASLSPTQLLIALGINDWLVGGPSLANFSAYYAGMLDAIHAVLPTIPIACVTPTISTGREGANALGITMDNIRSAIAAEVSARSGWSVPPALVDGKTILTAGDLLDGVHPTTTAHRTLMLPAMMAAAA